MLALASNVDAARTDARAQPRFASPEDALTAMVDAMRRQLTGALTAIVGPGSQAWRLSGDDVADRAAMAKFVAAYDERHAIARSSEERASVTVGRDDWPLPIPLVKSGNAWHFDGAAGHDEVLARRIGRNELDTIQVLEALADAQVEYARAGWAGPSLVAYAQKFAAARGARINQDGVVYQKDLGPRTAQAVAATKRFDPGPGWTKAGSARTP